MTSAAFRMTKRHFNPRAPRGARQHDRGLIYAASISTHAPREGRDSDILYCLPPAKPFQPTRPARGATQMPDRMHTALIFQPTRPARGATKTFDGTVVGQEFQPTRPARGATNT